MIKILKIVPQKFKKEYSTVFLGPDSSIKLHEDVVAQFHLCEGMEITEEKLGEVRFVEEKKEALEFAYLFLSYRTRSTQEMAERLRRKGFSKELIHLTLEELRTQKLLNDEEFAKSYAEGRLKNKLMGDGRIQEELARKGIDREAAEEILESVKAEHAGDIPDEDERAYQSILKRARQIKEIDSHTLHRRLYGHLVRQGFSPDTIERALHRLRKERRQS